MTDLLNELPLVAILRGVTPARVEGVAAALFEAGIRAIEVPLNSPEPFKSIELLAKTYGDRCLTGAGTVLDIANVDRVADVGGKLLVTPNTNPAVIARGVERKMVVMPGFYTPSEAFAAIAAGARALKLFPAATGGTAHLKALSGRFAQGCAGLCRGRRGCRQHEGMAPGRRGRFRHGLGPVQAGFQRCGNRCPRAPECGRVQSCGLKSTCHARASGHPLFRVDHGFPLSRE